MITKVTLEKLWDNYIEEQKKALQKLKDIKGLFNTLGEMDRKEKNLLEEADKASDLYWVSQAIYDHENQNWEEFSEDLISNRAAMKYAFVSDLYSQIPDEHKYEVAIGSYFRWGYEMPEVRAAVQEVTQNSTAVLPPELDGMDEITVYRGCTEKVDEVKNSMSWVTDLESAKLYRRAQEIVKKKPACIYRGKIRKEDVLVCVESNGRYEIIQHGNVYDIEDITDQVQDGKQFNPDRDYGSYAREGVIYGDRIFDWNEKNRD